MSASWISRVRFEVMTTIGGCSALTVPSSGIVTWKSASTSSRNASKASSVRSSSSISSTGAPAGSGSSACSSGRLIRKRSENTSLLDALAVALAFGLGERGSRSSARRNSTHRPRTRRRAPRSIAAGSAGGRASRPAPWRSRSCRRRPRLRGRAAGPFAAPGTARSRASGRRDSRPRRAASAWRRWRPERLFGVLFHRSQLTPSWPSLSRPSRPCCHARPKRRCPAQGRA